MFKNFILASLLLPTLVQAQDTWSIDDFLSTLKNNKVSTIEAALETLPEEVRSRFILMHKGHGLRGTSYQSPGAILFSNKGEYAITFGDPNMALGDELEVMRLNKKESRIELFSAVFPTRENGLQRIEVTKNPAKCLSCHGQDPMLLWTPYRHWPGAYGETNDVIMTNTEEYKQFMTFMQEIKNKTPYNTLKPSKGLYVIPLEEYLNGPDNLMFHLRPNTRYSFIVPAINGQRLARKIMEQPQYDKIKFDVVANMIACEGNNKLIPLLKTISMGSNDLSADINKFAYTSNKTPDFGDGASTLYNQTHNSIINYALTPLFSDLIRTNPTLESLRLPIKSLSSLFLSSKNTPENRAAILEMNEVGPFTVVASLRGAELCAELKRLSIEANN